MRIAVLECDSPLPKTAALYHGFGGVFEALLKAGAQDLGRPDPHSGLQISHHQIELHPDHYPDLKDIDAILITGSSEHILNKSLSFLGVCVCLCVEVAFVDRNTRIQFLR